MALASKKASFLLVLQDRPNNDGSASDGERQTEELLDKSMHID